MKRKRPVTQSEIAKAVGISQAAVSVILSGMESINVNPGTRARVIDYAQKMGYKPRSYNKGATRSNGSAVKNLLLVEDRTDTIEPDEWVAESYQAVMGKILTTAESCAREHNMGLNFTRHTESEAIMRWIGGRELDGVLWHSKDSDKSLLHWIATRMPLVLINREWRSTVLFDSVSVDQELNVTIAAERLWELGHRKIAYFGHTPGDSIHRRRLFGYTQFIEDREARNYSEFQGLSDAIDIPASEKVASILELWKKLGKEAPTAIISHDKIALFLLREAQRKGIKVPKDLSVIGIDNTPACTYVEPALTSVDEPFSEMTRVAVELLLRRIKEPSASSQSVQIAPNLVDRRSVWDFNRGDVFVAPKDAE